MDISIINVLNEHVQQFCKMLKDYCRKSYGD